MIHDDDIIGDYSEYEYGMDSWEKDQHDLKREEQYQLEARRLFDEAAPDDPESLKLDDGADHKLFKEEDREMTQLYGMEEWEGDEKDRLDPLLGKAVGSNLGTPITETAPNTTSPKKDPSQITRSTILPFFCRNGDALILWHMENGFLFLNLKEGIGSFVWNGNEGVADNAKMLEFLFAEDSLGFLVRAETDILVSTDLAQLFKERMVLHGRMFLRRKQQMVLMTKTESQEWLGDRIRAHGGLVVVHDEWPTEYAHPSSDELF